MWIADKWQDFELLDCSGGEKLERWGKYYLVRPDPQAIWDTPRKNPHWNDRDARYRRSESGGGSWDKGRLPANWDWAMGKIRAAGRPINVLNLFAYTGAATVACAKAGAQVCHVDAAKGMVAWGKENAASSGLSDAPIRWIVDDCAKFVEREIRRGRRYDAIIMDPPSYGRGPGGEVWKLEQNLWPFVSLCAGVLSDEPLFVLINSYTTGLSASVLSYVTESIFTKKFGGRSESRELGLPVTDSGLVLPCGASCRWES